MWELLDLGEGNVFEVREGKENPWDFQMRRVKRDLLSGPGLSSNWDEYLFRAIQQRGRAYIQFKEGKFQMAYDPHNSLRITPDFEIVGKYTPPMKKSKRKGLKTNQKNSGVYYYRFGNVVTADVAGLALYLFGEINTYTIGQAYSWNNQNKYTPVEISGEYTDFDLEDFEAAGKHYSPNGKVQGAIFYHREIGLVNGLKDLVKKFPLVTSREVRSLYRKFGMEPSSQIGTLLKTSEDFPKRPSRKRKKEPLPIEGLDLIQYIGRHHIKMSKGLVEIYSQEFGQEIVVNSPYEIVQTIRSNGDEIETGLGPKIWKEVTGEEWQSGDDGE